MWNEFYISEILPGDNAALKSVVALLEKEGLKRDPNLDYICGLYDEEGHLAATGSCFRYMLRCLAVDSRYQGEGLMSRIVSHLVQVQALRGSTHLFLHTKPSSAVYFRDLGFYEIAATESVVFMENRRRGFADYLEKVRRETRETQEALETREMQETKETGSGAKEAAIVMNANPFTLGHQFLVQTAAAQCDLLHVFVVSEDAGQIPAKLRKQMVREGTAHIPNVVLHDCGPYMISFATFPGYFLKGEDAVILGQAGLDMQIFIRIARAHGISARFAGEEPLSHVTDLYNRVMRQDLEKAGIECHIIPRLELDGEPVSASRARKALLEGDTGTFRKLVPDTTAALMLHENPGAAR